MQDYSVLTTLDSIWSIAKVVIDMCIVFLVVFYLINQIKHNNRTLQIFKGILIILTVNIIASLADLKAVKNITDYFINWGFLALIVVFQPEIRLLLEKIGKTSIGIATGALLTNEKEKLVQDLFDATVLLSQNKTGALITIENKISLEDYTGRAHELNANVSPALLSSIFLTTGPMHDGAVIIKGNKLTYAGVYFPSNPQEISNRYGSRHRAALSISQISDSLTIVVSEETSAISVAYKGNMFRVDRKGLLAELRKIIIGDEVEISKTSDNLQNDRFYVYDADKKRNIDFKNPFNNRNKVKKISSEKNNEIVSIVDNTKEINDARN